MRQVRQVSIWSFIIFVALTIVTMEQEARFDGFNRYGYPFTFYDYFGGICDDCYHEYGFKGIFLFADIALSILAAIILVALKNNQVIRTRALPSIIGAVIFVGFFWIVQWLEPEKDIEPCEDFHIRDSAFAWAAVIIIGVSVSYQLLVERSLKLKINNKLLRGAAGALMFSLYATGIWFFFLMVFGKSKDLEGIIVMFAVAMIFSFVRIIVHRLLIAARWMD